jgi:hypothetical protein
MTRLARHALTYFATAGILLTIAGGALLLTLIDKYNKTRIIDVPHASTTLLAIALGQTLLTTGVTAYIATRRGYAPPPLPPLPKAETVALIPAYREGGRVGKVVEEVKRHVDLVIVVDDGSPDGTALEAERAGAIVIRHPVNMGYGAAVKTLMRAALSAGASYAVLLDADGQHDPRDIPKFLEALRRGADLAVGDRFRAGGIPLHRRIGIAAIKALLLILFRVKAEDPENGYRAFTRTALERLEPLLEEVWMGVSSQTIYHASRSGMKIVFVPTAVSYSPTKTSTENPLSHGLSIVWTLAWVWLTVNPLRTLVMGLAALAASVTLFCYVALLFNATRYIRLAYTAAAVVLEVAAVVLTSVAATQMLTRHQHSLGKYAVTAPLAKKSGVHREIKPARGPESGSLG